MRNHTHMMQIDPPDDWLKTGWTRDSQARTRLVDSLFCITCSPENNAFFVLLFFFLCYLTFLYVTSIRDFFYPWNNRARLYQAAASQPPSSRGCSLAIIIQLLLWKGEVTPLFSTFLRMPAPSVCAYPFCPCITEPNASYITFRARRKTCTEVQVQPPLLKCWIISYFGYTLFRFNSFQFNVISQCNTLMNNICNILTIYCKAPLGITGNAWC